MNYCISCNKNTNYQILAHFVKSYDEDYRCTYKYLIVQCKGCDEISFRYEFHDIEGGYPSYDPYRGEYWEAPITIETFPKVSKYKLIEGCEFVPEAIYKTYKQTLSAYQEEATILAGIGFRAIIEAICSDQNVKENNLQQSISKLYSSGILSKHDSNLLHSIRFLGNDAAHEIKEPTKGQLDTALKIIEHLLISLYILPKDVERVMETVIENYDEFEILLIESISKYNTGDELPLKVIVGKEMRRFLDNISILQVELQSRINSGVFTRLKIGKVDYYQDSKKRLQHYIVQ